MKMTIPAPPLYDSTPYRADDDSRLHEGDNGNSSDGFNSSQHQHSSGSISSGPSPTSGGQTALHNQKNVSTGPVYREQLPNQQYFDYYRTAQTMYGPDSQHAAYYDEPYGQSCEITDDESFNEELHTPSTPPSSVKEQLLPSVFSLAQKLMPTVMKRLGQQEPVLIDDDEDFAGHCSPLGSPTSSSHPSVACLKTTGLEESDYANSDRRSIGGDDVEAGISKEEITEYLPQSAALLVSALQSSARKIKKSEGASLLPIESNDQNSDPMALRRSNTLEMEQNEREADALLDSIRRDELKHQGSGIERDSASMIGSAAIRAAASGGDSSVFFDDDDSIAGDMGRLTRSIASIQRDLENADISHLEGLYNDGFGDVGSFGAYDGENSLLKRFKLWFSRGMIMEQKLLNTYTSNGDDGAASAATTSSGRYMDNPVLVWSLALMWSFVVLILMHPKIAEFVEESGDEGQMADIIEWLFS
mmetsp:Transcript_19294/g.40680  ORF Transcript_19294/g.40680 Transcript_19294/m.40680 type:complete len:474 (+) Transcript_19294:73-1494(+)